MNRLFQIMIWTSVYIYISSTKLEVEQFNTNSDTAKSQLEKIQNQAKHARYGKCWTEALNILQDGCRNLSDETQRRIAYAFARCHLQSSGRTLDPCLDYELISECTDASVMSDLAFNAYTEFFTHTQEICFHLQSQAWHEATENTISRLSDNSQAVAERLEESSEIVKEVISQQEASLHNQLELLQNDKQLRHSIEKSVLDVKKSHTETKEIIQEQRILFSEVFDKFNDLQRTILGQFSNIYSFGFYLGAVVVSYIVTSTTVTQSARIWLFVIITLNAAAERIITDFYLGKFDRYVDNFPYTGMELSDIISQHIWISRKIATAFAVLLLVVKILKYKDYNRINNKLLVEIKQELVERKKRDDDFMATIEGFKTTTKTITHATVKPDPIYIEEKALQDTATSDNTLINTTQPTLDLDNTCSTVVEVKDFKNDFSDDDLSFHASDDDDSSVSSMMTSCSSISNASSIRLAFVSSTSRRSSTPLRDSMLDYSSDSNNILKLPQQSDKTRRRTTSFIREETVVKEGFRIGGYNLRRRPATPKADNSILQRESPGTFAQRIHARKIDLPKMYKDTL